MTRPADSLLAWSRAGALPDEVDSDFALSAIEHRVGGLLATEVLADESSYDPGVVRLLTGADMASRATNSTLYDLAYSLTSMLAQRDIEATILKGIGVEACWYSRVGERPTSDLDLLVWTDGPASVANAVRIIDPAYPHPEVVGRLVDGGQLQSVDLAAGRHRVDLHFDPLKLGVWTREPEQFQRTQQQLGSRDDVVLQTFGAECTLVELVMHLNKDSFAFLGSFVDVVRVIRQSSVDWDLVHRVVDTNGLRVPFWKSLALIAETLAVDVPAPPRLPRAQSSVWTKTWSPDHVLLGNEGRVRAPKRQRMLPLTIQGRPRDVAREMGRRLRPNSELYVVQGIKPKRLRWLRAASDSARARAAR